MVSHLDRQWLQAVSSLVAGPISELPEFLCPRWPHSVRFCCASSDSWRPHPTFTRGKYRGFPAQERILAQRRAAGSDGQNGLDRGAAATAAQHHSAAGEKLCHPQSWAALQEAARKWCPSFWISGLWSWGNPGFPLCYSHHAAGCVHSHIALLTLSLLELNNIHGTVLCPFNYFITGFSRYLRNWALCLPLQAWFAPTFRV